MDIVFTIPDAEVQRVVDAVAGSYGYDPATDGTKGQFTKKYVVKLLKQITKNYEANQASNLAAAGILGQQDVDIT